MPPDECMPATPVLLVNPNRSAGHGQVTARAGGPERAAASAGAFLAGPALPLRRSGVPRGVGVGIVEDRGRGNLRVHALGPRVRSELPLQVLDGLPDDLPGLTQV